jgi:hypothetical protein
MVYMIWQYAKKRQGAKQARLPKEFKFPQLTGRQLQVWFLGVLHRELICRDRRYDSPRLSFSVEHDDFMTVSDIPIVSDFAVILDDGSRDFGLDIMGHVRTLKDYSVTQPANLAEENSNIMERRLEDEKKKRNSRRAALRDAAVEANERDNRKPMKTEGGPSGSVPPTSSL